MPSIGVIAKYIGLFSIGKGFVDKAVFQRLLVGIAAVAGLSVIAGLLVGAIVLGLLGIQYYTMLQAGLSQTTAIIITAVVALLILALLIYKIVQLAKKISTYSSLLSQSTSPVSPITDAVSDVVSAFVSGLKDRNEDNKQAQQSKSATKRFPKSVK